MKLLLDACVWPGAVAELARHGHDVLWAGNFPGDPADDDLLAFALNEGRVVVTLDKDFGELAVAFGRPHAGIIRIVNSRFQNMPMSAAVRWKSTATRLPWALS